MLLGIPSSTAGSLGVRRRDPRDVPQPASVLRTTYSVLNFFYRWNRPILVLRLKDIFFVLGLFWALERVIDLCDVTFADFISPYGGYIDPTRCGSPHLSDHSQDYGYYFVGVRILDPWGLGTRGHRLRRVFRLLVSAFW
jgi:hypothetical protein